MCLCVAHCLYMNLYALKYIPHYLTMLPRSRLDVCQLWNVGGKQALIILLLHNGNAVHFLYFVNHFRERSSMTYKAQNRAKYGSNYIILQDKRKDIFPLF